MKYLSLFSGIGGFELGVQQAYETKNRGMGGDGQEIHSIPGRQEAQHSTGVGDKQASGLHNGTDEPAPTCVGYSEIDKYAIQIYEKHFNHRNYGDITTLDPATLPDFDLLVGGFPCQSFSIAGKRRGFADTRGTLFFDIARILQTKKPRLLLLENVKGLLSHDNGQTFKTIISTLDELGYDLQWQVLNSKNHGVPQNRERIFIVGHLRGTRRPQVFPFGSTDEKVDGNMEIKQHNQPVHSNERVYGGDGIAPTLNTMQGGMRQPKILDKNIDGKIYEYSYCPPLRTAASNYNMSLHGAGKIRRLTPTECERLQGFPDGHTDGVSDTQRYKTLGNAVTVNVVQAIIERLI